jgi:hypothetical protein
MRKVLTRLGLFALLASALCFVRGPGEALVAREGAAGDLPPDLARISGRAHFLISFRPADLWETPPARGAREALGKDVSHITKDMERQFGLAPTAIERVTLVMPMVAPGVEPVFYVAAKKAVEKKEFLEKLVPGGTAKTHAGQEYYANDRRAVLMLDDRHFVVGGQGDVQTVIDQGKAKPEGALLPALRLAAGKHGIVVAGNPEAIAKNLPNAPEIEPFKPLLAATMATLAIDVGEKSAAQMRLTFPNAEAAKKGAKALEAARGMLLGALAGARKGMEKDADMKGITGLLGDVEASVKAAKLTQSGATLASDVEVNLGKSAAVVAADAAMRAREAARRMQSANNLKQIGLAMHNYHTTYNNFPPAATYDKNGKPLLSWRVLILPYIEQDALYKEFKLDEPWDSPHNKKLIEKMPKVYELPGATTQHKHGTFYQVFHGKGAGFEGKTSLRITDFLDGTSNTILVVEAGRDVPWTKPEDVEFDPGKAVPSLGGAFKKGFNAGFADGSVRFLQQSINKDTLKALITRNGGEVIKD